MNEPEINTAPGLRLEGIIKSFGGKPVLRGADLDVERGCFMMLLGESGCGKTTLLRIVAGFEKPDAGRVYVCGKDVTGLPPGERGVRTVPQSDSLFPHMSAAGNIAFALRARKTNVGGRLRRMSTEEARSRAEEILRALGLGGMGGRRADTLSGGERQRVAIARAAACGARVILLDEPMSALDALSREQMRGWLGELHEKTGITVLCVTHDRDEAMRTGSRIAVMSGGRIVRCGTTEDVYRHPGSYDAARLTGECGVLRGIAADGTAAFACGLRVPCAGAGTAEAYVRPENVSVSAEGGVIGTVEECAFAGDGYMLTVSVAGGTLLVRSSDRLPAGAEVALKISDTEAVAV